MENKARSPAVLAISGAKNTGKTTLIARLLPLLAARGLAVGVIKHDGHTFQPDTPGTDTRRFWDQGARRTAVFDGEKAQLVLRGRFDEAALLPLFAGMDLVLLEGFKHSAHPKLELLRGQGEPLTDPRTRLALVSDRPLPDHGLVLHPDDLEGIAALVARFAASPR